MPGWTDVSPAATPKPNFQPGQNSGWTDVDDTPKVSGWQDESSPQPAPIDKVQGYIDKAAGNDPKFRYLLSTVANIETSGGRNVKTSDAGAVGVMQIKPETAAQYGFDPTRLDDPEYNISVGAHILRHLYDRAKGNRVQAAVAYNQGEGMLGTPYAELPAEGQNYARLVTAAIKGEQTPETKAVADNAPAPSRGTFLTDTTDKDTRPAYADFAAPDIRKNPLYREAGKLAVSAGETAEWTRTHPGQALLDVLGAPGQGVEKLLTDAVEKGHVDLQAEGPFALGAVIAATFSEFGWQHPFEALKSAGVAAVHPSDHQAIVTGLEQAIFKGYGFDGVPHEVAHGIGKTILDLATDVATDPFTVLPGDLVFGLAKASRVMAHSFLNAELVKSAVTGIGKTGPGGKLLSGIEASKNAMVDAHAYATKFMNYLTETRPELKPYFSHLGKMAYMSVEHVADYTATRHLKDDMEIARRFVPELKATNYGAVLPKDVAQHLLTRAWKYGTQADRVNAEMHMANLGIKVSPQDAKDFAKPKGYLDFGGDVQKNYISALKVGKNLQKKLGFQAKEAHEWLDANADNAVMPFSKAVTGAHPYTFHMGELIPKVLDLQRESIRAQTIAHTAAELTTKYGLAFVSHGSGLQHVAPDELAAYFRNKISQRSDAFTRKIKLPEGFQLPGSKKWVNDIPIGAWLRRISDFDKMSILGNPFPHALLNVGQVALLRANPFVAARGLRYGIGGLISEYGKLGLIKSFGSKLGVPEKLDREMEAMGAKTSYWRDPQSLPNVDPTSWFAKAANHAFGTNFKGGFETWFTESQKIMDHLETGYRASYLQHLDKHMGTLEKSDPNFQLHQLIKGQVLQDHIGDYANPSRIVGMAKAVGGLYDVFRLGVVPQAATAALHGQFGQTIAALLQAENDFSENITPHSYEHIFGVAEDYAKMLFAPEEYAISKATLGQIVGGVLEDWRSHKGHANYHPGLLEDTMDLLQSFEPNVGAAEKLIDPFNKEKNVPGWVKFWIEAVAGGWNQPEPQSKTLREDRRSWGKSIGR